MPAAAPVTTPASGEPVSPLMSDPEVTPLTEPVTASGEPIMGEETPATPVEADFVGESGDPVAVEVVDAEEVEGSDSGDSSEDEGKGSRSKKK